MFWALMVGQGISGDDVLSLLGAEQQKGPPQSTLDWRLLVAETEKRFIGGARNGTPATERPEWTIHLFRPTGWVSEQIRTPASRLRDSSRVRHSARLCTHASIVCEVLVWEEQAGEGCSRGLVCGCNRDDEAV